MIRTPLITVIVDAVMKAARGLKRDFGEVENLQVSRKGPSDFVSAADRKSEEVLYEALAKARPGYGFKMEERGIVEGADKSHVWHIDPLDGTTNFLHGIPQFSISVGLERDRQIVAGVVYDLIKDELYVAERGQGAFLNNRRLRVSARTDLADCLIACGVPFLGHGNHPEFLRELAAVMARTAGVRRMGSAALDLCAVAAGRCDGYWERNLSSHDIAAGVVIVREAGGFVSDADGGERILEKGSVIAGNESVQRELIKILKAAGKVTPAPTPAPSAE